MSKEGHPVNGLFFAGAILYGLGAVGDVVPSPKEIVDGFLDGGESDPAPRGSTIYQGQEAISVSERFLYEIGRGQAVVMADAKQDHDKDGGLFQGDFQSTNGTSFVSDPETGGPAALTLVTRYCAEGQIEVYKQGSGLQEEITGIIFDMGNLAVCEATFENTPENYSAFTQDDVPDDKHGAFVSFIRGAAETIAIAAECPEDELARYTSPNVIDYYKQVFATKYGVDQTQVEVKPGTIAITDANTQQELQARLDSYNNKQDPDDPSKTYPALEIQFLGGSSAVTGSCYMDSGGVSLESIENFNFEDLNMEEQSAD